MASFFTIPPVLKPVPVSLDTFLDEIQLCQDLGRDSELPPRAKLYHYMVSSAKIKRPLDTAMILLVGSSGVGKSSTINHLLDTGEGNPVAMTSTTKSETRETCEYVLTIDEPNYKVCDLKMRVVDTPGFNDTFGTNQDACNLVSIKRFFETHPSFHGQLTFPNLVFLVVSAVDQRIKGPNSNFSKCLRGIKLLNLIDTLRPNLVVVVTFCCSVGYKNVNKWNERMREKKHLISEAVYEALGIYAPLVLIENDYKDMHYLERDGDYTLLPNGEKQPKNLYDACLKLLERSKDYFGLMVLNAAFQRCKKSQPTNGHKVEAKDSRVEILSDEEEKFSNALCKVAKEGHVLALRAIEYVTEKHLGQSQEEKIMKLVETMNSLGLSSKERLQEVTIGEINCVHSEEVSKHGIEMLKEKFGIKNEIASFNPVEFVGQGYNIIIDKSVSAQIMTFSAMDDTKFGFRIPAYAKIDKVNETRKCQIDFESDETRKRYRLYNLGLNVDLASTLSEIAPQFELSLSGKNNCSGKSMKTTKSSMIEYRLAKISIPNLKSDDISFTSVFYSAVKELPDHYTSEEKLKQEFEKFFNRFGHFVVVSAYVGGAIEVKICNESLEKEYQWLVDGSVGANVSGVIGVEARGEYQRSTENASKVVPYIETRWQGGLRDLHINSTLQSEKNMLMWKASLSKEPAVLTTELSLKPISSVVAIIDKMKGKVCYQALRDCFHGKDLYPVRSLHNQLALEEKKKIESDEQECRRNKSNSRSGTTKEPDTMKWLDPERKTTVVDIIYYIGDWASNAFEKVMRFLADNECKNDENHTAKDDCRAKVPINVFETGSDQPSAEIREPILNVESSQDPLRLEKPEEISKDEKMSNKIAEARSLALQFMSAHSCCIRAIPYENVTDPQSLTICLYVDTDGKGIPKDVKQAAKQLFANYHIEFDDLQRRPLSKIVTPLSSSEKHKEKELSDLSTTIEKNLYLFENRLNITAVRASYKVTDFTEQNIPCVTVFVLGKGRIPAGETNIEKIKQLNDYPFDVVEGYYQPTNGSSNKSYAFYLRGGVGIGVVGGSGAGTLGGFLKDEEGKCYILSNEHVFRPSDIGNNNNEIIIQQPAQLDYDELLEKAKQKLTDCTNKKLELVGKEPGQTQVEIDFKDDEYFGPIIEDMNEAIKDAQRELNKVENKKPRQIAKYVCGLQRNVPLGDNYSELIFVDAAIAMLDEVELKRMKTDKETQSEKNRCPLYGFEDSSLNCNTIDIENFPKELSAQESKLSFMKIGRTSGKTSGARIDRCSGELEIFVNDISSLYHVKFEYCNDCVGVDGEKGIHQNECIKAQRCARCDKELNNDEFRPFWLHNCLVVRLKRGKVFCEKGDSGSLLFGNDGRAWGLVFGLFHDLSREFDFCLASPISATLKALEEKSGKKLKLWCTENCENSENVVPGEHEET